VCLGFKSTFSNTTSCSIDAFYKPDMIRARPDAYDDPQWGCTKRAKIGFDSPHFAYPPLHENTVNIAHQYRQASEAGGSQGMQVDENPGQVQAVGMQKRDTGMDVEECHEQSGIPPCHARSFRSYVGLGGEQAPRWHAHGAR
jgi:hypothetical protein